MSENSEGLAGILTAVLAHAQIVQAADNAVDDKSHSLMAAALVIITLLAFQLKNESGEWQILTIMAMVVSFGVVPLTLYLTRDREYFGTVVDLKRHPEYFQKSSSQLLAQLIEDARFANRYNERILTEKQTLLRKSALLFIAGFCLGIVSLFVSA